MLLQVAALFQSVLAVRSKRVVKLVCRGSVNLPHSEYMHMLSMFVAKSYLAIN